MGRRTHVAVVVAVALVASAAGAALAPAVAHAAAADRPTGESSGSDGDGDEAALDNVERALAKADGVGGAETDVVTPGLAPGVTPGDALVASSTVADGGDGLPFGLVGPGVAVAAGYSRHDDTSALENPTRRRIADEIARSPGTHVSALVTATDAARSTVRYHLRVLERDGHVFDERIGGKHRFFPAGSDAPALAAALADDASGAVVKAVARTEPATVSELAEVLDRSPSTVSYHLSRLESDGVVDRERRGEAVVTTLTEAARTHLHPDADADAGTDSRSDSDAERSPAVGDD